MENLTIYNQLKSVPKEFLKTIGAGRLKGMSDIKPQWRILKLTETFGACGFGWKIQNLRFDYRNVENEVVVNCYLEFLYKNSNNEWSEPIPGVGGSNFSTFENKTNYDTQRKERTLYVSDEAEKMAYTDAISVATKMIGLAGDIYIGHGGKYDNNELTNNKIITASQKIESCTSLDDLGTVWNSLTKDEQKQFVALKDAKKLQLSKK